MNYYLIMFSFLRFFNKVKRGVELRDSTRNASDIPRKVGNTMFPLTTLLNAGYSVKLKIEKYYYIRFNIEEQSTIAG